MHKGFIPTVAALALVPTLIMAQPAPQAGADHRHDQAQRLHQAHLRDLANAQRLHAQHLRDLASAERLHRQHLKDLANAERLHRKHLADVANAQRLAAEHHHHS